MGFTKDFVKRVLRSGARIAKNYNIEEAADKQLEKIEKGAPVRAPRYPSENKAMMANDAVGKEDDSEFQKMMSRDPLLEDRVGEMEIHSHGPSTSEKALTVTRDAEHQYQTRKISSNAKYGILEPPSDKIPADKLTFTEAMTLMAAKTELKIDPNNKQAETVIRDHAATVRVDRDIMDAIYYWFGPFEKKGTMTRTNVERRYLREKTVYEEVSGVKMTAIEYNTMRQNQMFDRVNEDYMRLQRMADDVKRDEKDRQERMEQAAAELTASGHHQQHTTADRINGATGSPLSRRVSQETCEHEMETLAEARQRRSKMRNDNPSSTSSPLPNNTSSDSKELNDSKNSQKSTGI